MSHRSAVHELKTLVLSFHSLLAVETVEEERIRSLLMEVANDLRLPFYEWSVTEGLRRLRGPTVDATQDALTALRHIERIDGDGIYLLKDLAPYLSTASVARALRDLAKDKPPVTPTPGKMTAFGIRLRSIGHLHKKWKFL